jgi:hypothetical protein
LLYKHLNAGGTGNNDLCSGSSSFRRTRDKRGPETAHLGYTTKNSAMINLREGFGSQFPVI